MTSTSYLAYKILESNLYTKLEIFWLIALQILNIFVSINSYWKWYITYDRNMAAIISWYFSEVTSLCDYGNLKLDFNLLTADCLNNYLEILVPQSMPCTVVTSNLDAGQEATAKTGHGTTDWFQIGKGVLQGCVFHPAYLTYMQSTSWEMLSWRKHKLESRLQGEIPIISDICRWHHPYGRKWRRTKEPLDEIEGECKSWLKVQHSEN